MCMRQEFCYFGYFTILSVEIHKTTCKSTASCLTDAYLYMLLENTTKNDYKDLLIFNAYIKISPTNQTLIQLIHHQILFLY